MVSITDLLEENAKPEEPPPLTKAEKKKLKKQQQKLEKEQKIRYAQEAEMAREIKVAKKNIQNYRNRWKEIRMEKGRPEYKEYMMEHWCLFDHLMDKKDKLIEIFTEELEITERTRLTSVMDHMRTTEQVLTDFNDTMENLKQEMQTSKFKLLGARDMDVDLFKKTTSRADENMRLVLFLIDRKKKEDDEVWGGEFVMKKDEEISINRSETELLIARMEVKLMKLWKDYKDIIEEYAEYSKSILVRSDVLKEKVDADDQLIRDQAKKLKEFKRLIDGSRDQVAAAAVCPELRDLRTERNELYKTYTDEKRRVDRVQAEHRQRISNLIDSNNDTNIYLERIAKKGRKITALQEMCSRMETPKEQFAKETMLVRIYGTDNPIAHKMTKFWKRVARVDMITRLMHVENRKMKNKNAELKREMALVLQSSKLQAILKDVTECSRQLFNNRKI